MRIQHAGYPTRVCLWWVRVAGPRDTATLQAESGQRVALALGLPSRLSLETTPLHRRGH